MVEKKDYVDITPTGVDDEGRGSRGRSSTVFQESEIMQILDNPSRLTKEGILKKIDLWQHSSNSHVVLKYQSMLKRCKNISPSGKTKEGYTILSRDKEGNPKWVDIPLPSYSNKDKEEVSK